MTKLEGLRNLLVAGSRDEAELDQIQHSLKSFITKGQVRRQGRWIIATAELPLSEDEPPEIQEAGIFFVEGRRNVASKLTNLPSLVDAIDPPSRRLSAYPGDFGFAAVTEERLTVVRSAGGRVPFYLHLGEDLVIVSSLMSWLVRALRRVPPLDALTSAIYTTGWGIFPDQRTFFVGVEELRRGHVARVLISQGRSSARIDKFWDPRPAISHRPTEAAVRQHQEELRHLLLTYLDRELPMSASNLLTLSGGVDSSSLAALSAGALNRPVSSLTLTPVQEPYISQEARYIRELARHFAFVRQWDFPLDLRHRVELLQSSPQVAFCVVHPALGALRHVIQEDRPAVMFGGEFADQTCGSVFTLPDWARHSSLRDLLKHPRAIPHGRVGLKRWLRYRWTETAGSPFHPWPVDLPEWIRMDVREAYRDFRSDLIAREKRDERPWRYLDIHARSDTFLAMNWEATSAAGVRRAWPFFNREILELTYSCHPTELIGPGFKKLLRGALKGDVPAMNLFRNERGHWPSPEVELPAPRVVPAELGRFLNDETIENPASAEGWQRFWLWAFTKLLQDSTSLARPAPATPGGERLR